MPDSVAPTAESSRVVDQLTAQVGIENIIGIALVIAAVFLALLAHWLLFKLLHRIVARHNHVPWSYLVERVRGPVRLWMMILAVELTLPLVQMPPRAEAAVSHVTTLCIVGLVGWVAFLAVTVLTDFSISRHRIDVENNLQARKMRTRLRVLRQALVMIIFLVTVAAMLMTFPGARSIGVSLFASAGVAGIVVGFAARPVLSNLLAGIQIALTQPIRIQDAVVVEGEWGWVEEITSTYVVVKIWDWRRLIVPLSYFIEKPFQNWTRESASIIGSVIWHTDYTVPITQMREKLKEFLSQSKLWDGNVQVLQIIESRQDTMELRALMSAKNSPTAWDLRCEIREKMIMWLQKVHPGALPRNRVQVQMDERTPVEPYAPEVRDSEAGAMAQQIDTPEEPPEADAQPARDPLDGSR